MTTTFPPLSSKPTLIGPLTTVFTPPQRCHGFTAWCEPNLIPHQFFRGGFLNSAKIQEEFRYTECYPPGYPAQEAYNFYVGYATTAGVLGPYFSPGVCPASYYTAYTEVLSTETRGICCYTGLTFDPTHGCVTSYKASHYQWTRTAEEYFVSTYTNQKPEPIITKDMVEEDPDMFGSVIEIRWQNSDLQLLKTLTPVPVPIFIPSISGPTNRPNYSNQMTLTNTPTVISDGASSNNPVAPISNGTSRTSPAALISNGASSSSSGDARFGVKVYATLAAIALLLSV